MSCSMKSAPIRRALVAASLTVGMFAGFSGHSLAAADLPAKTVEVRPLDLHSWKLDSATGGFLGIGNKNLAVKWSDVTTGPGYEFVTTPITAESVKTYGLFDGFPKSSGPLAPRDWRASELIGDYVYLKGNVHYAFIRDLIVSEGGELKAVIVNPDVGFDHGQGGYFAYPFYGYQHGSHPGNAHYNLPYDKADITELLPYAYRK